MAAAAYAALTDEDWCTTQVHECAMLLGTHVCAGSVSHVYSCRFTFRVLFVSPHICSGVLLQVRWGVGTELG